MNYSEGGGPQQTSILVSRRYTVMEMSDRGSRPE